VRNADILIGYYSFPRTSMYETGLKTAMAAIGRLERAQTMHKLFLKLPIVAALERTTGVDDKPLAGLVQVISIDTPGPARSSAFVVPFRQLDTENLHPFYRDVGGSILEKTW
jgi:microcystin degradation protein MlrC